MMIFNCFSLSCGYTEIHAIKDNALYAVITPASENNMDIARFTGKGNGWSARIRYTGDKNSFFSGGAGSGTEGSPDRIWNQPWS